MSTESSNFNDKLVEEKKGRAFSLRLSSVRGNKSKSDVAETDDVIFPEEEEQDPVIQLFRSRTTHRVRFSLGGDENNQDVAKESSSASIATESTASSPGGATKKSLSIKRFINGALFSNGNKSRALNDEFEAEFAKEIENAKQNTEIVWGQTPDVDELRADDTMAFPEDPNIHAKLIKLLSKAQSAQHTYYRYEYAVNCYMKALDILQAHKYPEQHRLAVTTYQALNNAHHALNAYKNSSNIVKMGIKYEDSGELIRALKMYTVAYRIRRDNLSRSHPSLVVLLNMLGSVQIKRGELDEAMEIYQLALAEMKSNEDSIRHRSNLMTRSITYREMGVIFEKRGDTTNALEMYHKSLECVGRHRGFSCAQTSVLDSPTSVLSISLESVRFSRSYSSKDSEDGMELYFGIPESKNRRSHTTFLKTSSSVYDVFFPPSLEDDLKKGPKNDDTTFVKKGDVSDADVSLTLHQIGQLYRAEGEFNQALAAYTVSLRGMKYALGKNHPNVAAILGNIGNLQKEMGELDSAFETYQQVLGIESYRLGLSHPDVVVTLHNIATIDAARGNHEQALALYEQVVALQSKLFGEDHVSVAVTAACMGDVYERMNNLIQATECFEDAVRIKTAYMGRHSLEVARLLHKLGKLAIQKRDYPLADSYISRTILIYRLNKLSQDDEWVVDAYRDAADVDCAITMGKKLGLLAEC